jgi:hypothetical protein
MTHTKALFLKIEADSSRQMNFVLNQHYTGFFIYHFTPHSDSKSRRYLRWLVFGSSTYSAVRLRRLNPRRLDFILDLKSVLH